MKQVIAVMTVMALVIMAPVFAIAAEKAEAQSEWTEQLAEVTPYQHINIHGAIEAEAGYSSDYNNTKESDVDLTTVELGIDVELSEWISGFFLMKWEGDDEGVFVDQGGIVLGSIETMGASLTVGKLYVPFGTYNTNLISDPLALELGETREGAAVINVATGDFYGALYTFNSAVNKVNKEDDMIDAFGAILGYAMEADHLSFYVSAGWISNLTSSGGFSGYLDENAMDVDDYSSGIAVSTFISTGDFSLIAEYVAALDSKYDAGSNDKPSAWNLEVGYDFKLLQRDANIAVSYQETDDASFLGLPQSRIAAGISCSLTEYLTLALEVSKDKDYHLTDGGSGNNAEAAVVQLAFEF